MINLDHIRIAIWWMLGVIAGCFIGWIASLFGFWWSVPAGAVIGFGVGAFIGNWRHPEP